MSDHQSAQPTIDSELELIIRKLMTDTQSATATHEAIGWDETKVAPDMRRIEKEAAHTITNLIAQEANKARLDELFKLMTYYHPNPKVFAHLKDRIKALTADKVDQ